MSGNAAYVILLRGINVGGNRKVPMVALRAAFEAAGCTAVETYIQSGNAVLESALPAGELRAALEAAVRDAFGFDIDIMVRSAAEMAVIAAGNPYPLDDEKALHVAFLHAPPPDPAALAAVDCAPEALTVSGRELYYYLPNGMGRALLPAEVAKRCRAPMTVRNWRTVTKLAEMAAARG